MAADTRPEWAKTVAEHVAEAQADDVIREAIAAVDQHDST